MEFKSRCITMGLPIASSMTFLIYIFLRFNRAAFCNLLLGPFCWWHPATVGCPYHQNISASPAFKNIYQLDISHSQKWIKRGDVETLTDKKRTNLWQRLVYFYRIEASGSYALLPLLLLILLHGLFYANLGPATDSLLERLQLIIESILVLLVCSLI